MTSTDTTSLRSLTRMRSPAQKVFVASSKLAVLPKTPAANFRASQHQRPAGTGVKVNPVHVSAVPVDAFTGVHNLVTVRCSIQIAATQNKNPKVPRMIVERPTVVGT